MSGLQWKRGWLVVYVATRCSCSHVKAIDEYSCGHGWWQVKWKKKEKSVRVKWCWRDARRGHQALSLFLQLFTHMHTCIELLRERETGSPWLNKLVRDKSECLWLQSTYSQTEKKEEEAREEERKRERERPILHSLLLLEVSDLTLSLSHSLSQFTYSRAQWEVPFQTPTIYTIALLIVRQFICKSLLLRLALCSPQQQFSNSHATWHHTCTSHTLTHPQRRRYAKRSTSSMRQIPKIDVDARAAESKMSS